MRAPTASTDKLLHRGVPQRHPRGSANPQTSPETLVDLHGAAANAVDSARLGEDIGPLELHGAVLAQDQTGLSAAQHDLLRDQQILLIELVASLCLGRAL